MPSHDKNRFQLRMVAWEVTRSCNLACVHCRASARNEPYAGELSTEECFELLDEISRLGRPVIILTGGEPLLRDDIFDIAEYGTSKGFRMVMAPNGTLVDARTAERLKKVGILRISLSLDGATAAAHDSFRQVEGAFDAVLSAARTACEVGLEFQINSTVTSKNIADIPAIMNLAIEMGASAFHAFMLVPTGRARDLEDQMIGPDECEKFLRWLHGQVGTQPISIKATCAPHFYRIARQARREVKTDDGSRADGLDTTTRGCLAGVAFCFISHVGDVFPCGYLELNCGNVRGKSLGDIWAGAEPFVTLRDFKNYRGKCGRCEFVALCGGCRARAYTVTGDYLGDEPLCSYKTERSTDEQQARDGETLSLRTQATR